MKKKLLLLLAVVLLVLLALSVFLIIRFVSLASGGDASETAVDAAEVTAYANEHWPQYEAAYDAASQSLTLTKQTQLSYENACLVGASVYSGSTAPETYQSDAATIAVSVANQFSISRVTVTLRFLSTDGAIIFSVSSDGTVDTCWE